MIQKIKKRNQYAISISPTKLCTKDIIGRSVRRFHFPTTPVVVVHSVGSLGPYAAHDEQRPALAAATVPLDCCG
jgi:hypothetical protein